MKKGSYYILLGDQKKQNYKVKKMQGYIFEVNDLKFGCCHSGDEWIATSLENGLLVCSAKKRFEVEKECIRLYQAIKRLLDKDYKEAEYRHIYDKLIEEETIYHDRFETQV